MELKENKANAASEIVSTPERHVVELPDKNIEERGIIKVPGKLPIVPMSGQISQESIKESNDLFRQKKRLVHNIIIWFIRIFSILVAIAIILRAFHLLTPPSWHWLTPDQIQTIDNSIIAGIVGGILTKSVEGMIKDQI